MRITAPTIGVFGLAVGALALWHAPPSRALPRHIRIVSASGRPLGSFFDGLKTSQKQRASLKAMKEWRPACIPEQKVGYFGRAATFLGLGGTVHAQGYCYSGSCGGCYVQLVMSYCSGPSCSGPIWYGSTNGGEADQGTAVFGSLVCGPNPPCGCLQGYCTNDDCP